MNDPNYKDDIISLPRDMAIPHSIPSTSLDGMNHRILPDDCLYMIIDQLGSQPKELYHLLFVNKFFFNIAVKLLYNHRPFPYARDKLKLRKYYCTIFVSFLQQRAIESVGTSGNDKTPSQIIDAILEKYGLELVTSYTPSGIIFLQNMLNPKGFISNTQSEPNIFSPMTIDYSKLLTGLFIPKIRDRTIFNIRNTLTDEDGSTTRISTDEAYLTLELNVIDMLVHYNYSYIAAITITPNATSMFLPYASKLSNLKELHLYRNNLYDDTDLKSIVLFITTNQSTFPQKDPLKVPDWDEWRRLNVGNEPDNIDTSIESSFLFALRSHRNTILLSMQPVLAVYKAVGSPSIIRAHNIPMFYDHTESIKVDRLKELHDFDPYRIDLGEGKSREKFLQHCNRLKRLDINVDHLDAFLWASQDQLTSQDAPLMKLEELNIVWSSVSHAAIKALNDASTIFNSSLRSISLGFNSSCHRQQNIDYIEDTLTLRSLELQQLEEANTICNFQFLLPNLTSIKINLPHGVSIKSGSFDYCPNLKYLELGLGSDSPTLDHQLDGSRPIFGFIQSCRPDGVEPKSLPEPGAKLDRNWRVPAVVYDLFPTFNLPKLRHLSLEHMAATRFDFASLPLMQNLERLKLNGKSRYYKPRAPNNEYLIRQYKLSSDLKTFSSTQSINWKAQLFGSHYPSNWSLPYLTSLSIEGTPTLVFCLEYIRLFPALKILSLGWSGDPINLHRVPVPVQSLGDLDVTCTDRDSYDNTPIMKSQLQSIKLHGNWTMTILDLTSLLKVYAPTVELFTCDKLTAHDSEGKYGIFNAIDRALYTKIEYGDMSSPVQEPSKRYMKIVSENNLLTVAEVENEGLMELKIVYFDDEFWKALGIRTYHCIQKRRKPQALIRTRDFNTAKEQIPEYLYIPDVWKNDGSNDSESESE